MHALPLGERYRTTPAALTYPMFTVALAKIVSEHPVAVRQLTCIAVAVARACHVGGGGNFGAFAAAAAYADGASERLGAAVAAGEEITKESIS